MTDYARKMPREDFTDSEIVSFAIVNVILLPFALVWLALELIGGLLAVTLDVAKVKLGVEKRDDSYAHTKQPAREPPSAP